MPAATEAFVCEGRARRGDEAGAGGAAHGGQVVFGVVGQGGEAAVDAARDLVAVDYICAWNDKRSRQIVQSLAAALLFTGNSYLDV